MDQILSFLKDQITHNAFASGGLLIAVFGSVIALARNIPKNLWFFIRGQFLVTLDVQSHDDIFRYVVRYFENHKYGKKTRNITAGKYRDENGKVRLFFSPAPGKHFFFHKGWPIWIDRTRDKIHGNSGVVVLYEAATIQTIGRSRARLTEMVQDAFALANDDNVGKVVIHILREHWWSQVTAKAPRPLNSIILDDSAELRLSGDLGSFLDNKKWYLENGVPYHRGYLFYGPPGTGKSSTVLALAGAFGLNVHVANLSSIHADDDLLFAFHNVERGSILLLEDVDAAFQDRGSEDQKRFLTFSGLLNALDGVASADGTIIIMTTNHIEKLDPALIRPGRVDVRQYFGNATKDQARRLFLRFYPDRDDLADWFVRLYKSESKSPAELQVLFMKYRGMPENVIEDLQEVSAAVA
jgi:mitochondrial chaperone BCS1